MEPHIVLCTSLPMGSFKNYVDMILGMFDNLTKNYLTYPDNNKIRYLDMYQIPVQNMNQYSDIQCMLNSKRFGVLVARDVVV